MKTIYIGIDPGAKGAISFLDYKNETINFLDFDKVGIRGYAANLSHLNNEGYTLHIYLEQVHAMPNQGVSSMFSFGQRYGELQGMLQTLNLDYNFVRPHEWQRIIGVESKSGKQGIYNVVSHYAEPSTLKGPKGGIKDGRCDALGIALYAKLKEKQNAR